MAGNTELLELEREKLDFERECHARDRWWQEDRLINQRLTWLLTSHGVIGAGYAWLKHRISEIHVEVVGLQECKDKLQLLNAKLHYKEQLVELSDLLVVLGLIVSGLVLLGIGSALRAQHILQTKHYPQYRFYITTGTTIGGHLTALALPIVCLGAWAWISGFWLCFS